MKLTEQQDFSFFKDKIGLSRDNRAQIGRPSLPERHNKNILDTVTRLQALNNSQLSGKQKKANPFKIDTHRVIGDGAMDS